MKINEFVALVEKMRNAQREYFKTRDRRILQRSIMLENLVDQEIKHFNNETKKIIRQPNLFD